jgi:predicted nucleic acid-binding protein
VKIEPIADAMAFWDASAIVPLCCSQAATSRSRGLLRNVGRMVVWWGTPVEARNAFARLVRDRSLTEAERVKAVKLLDQLQPSWDEIQPSESVRAIAQDLPDRHGLRALDAMQLAAALVWCRERPSRRPFICFDERLSRAAAAVGFTVPE